MHALTCLFFYVTTLYPMEVFRVRAYIHSVQLTRTYALYLRI
jgi:hypothetical protein